MSQSSNKTRHPLVSVAIVAIIGMIALWIWQSNGWQTVQPESGVGDAGIIFEEPADNSQPVEDEPILEVSAPRQQVSDLPPVPYQELPTEAHDTIALIETNGPFPFSKDGAVFQNRERLLPNRPMGYYSEYTVITPGSDDRGARRIVAGADGELFYTDDHYSSFEEVMR